MVFWFACRRTGRLLRRWKKVSELHGRGLLELEYVLTVYFAVDSLQNWNSSVLRDVGSTGMLLHALTALNSIPKPFGVSVFTRAMLSNSRGGVSTSTTIFFLAREGYFRLMPLDRESVGT